MPKKITRELHAKVRESLKTMGIVSAARKHGISAKTVSRIKRGGRSFTGYKRELTSDHTSLVDEIWAGQKPSSTEPLFMEEPGSSRLKVFGQALKRVVRR